jgi:hypothetical protein
MIRDCAKYLANPSDKPLKCTAYMQDARAEYVKTDEYRGKLQTYCNGTGARYYSSFEACAESVPLSFVEKEWAKTTQSPRSLGVGK